jgi:hypothetical protein
MKATFPRGTNPNDGYGELCKYLLGPLTFIEPNRRRSYCDTVMFLQRRII